MPNRLARLTRHLAVLLLYGVLTCLALWPLPLFFTSKVLALNLPNDPNVAVDVYQHLWHQWWVAFALSHGQNPFFTKLLYYPEGIDLFWQTLGFSQGLAAMPVTLALGPVAGVNFTIFCSFIIGGYATFLLARRLTGSAAGGLVAGAVYAFSPYHMQKMSEGSIELTSIHWLPCYVWSLEALLDRPGWRRALLAGALLLWVSLGAWYYGLFAVLYTGCAVAIRMGAALTGRRDTTEGTPPTRAAARLALWGAAPLIMWALVLSPKIATIGDSVDQASWDLRQAQIDHAADLIDFFLPNALHPWWGDAVRTWRMDLRPSPMTFWNVALGMVGLPLALVGLAATWRRSWRWGALLAALLLLGLGPALRVAGVQTSVPLPFALIGDLPGIRTSHRPGHLTILASLMVAILAAYGVAHLARGRSPRLALAAAGLLALAVVGVDGSIARERLILAERRVHPFYATLPAPDGALMALPMYVNINRVDHMTAQTLHTWPIFAGYVARPPDYRFAYETNGVTQLRDGRAEPEDIVSPAWPESGQRALAAHRIRYVTLDLTTERDEGKLGAGKPEYFAAVRELLSQLGAGAPIAADADLEAYAIPRDWPVGPIGALGQGWRALEQQPGSDLRWRWMGAESTLRLFSPHERPVAATIRLSMASFSQPRSVQILLDGQPLGALEVGTAPTTRSVTFMLSPGEHILTLAAPADPDPGAGDLPTSVRAFAIGFSFGAQQGP